MIRKAHADQYGPLEGFAEDAVERLTSYARENPIPAMFWALGIGFVLGWRLRP
jgi:hypothetical protein